MPLPTTTDQIIAYNLRRAAVQLNAAYKKIKKYDPDNKVNAEAAVWLKMKIDELALEYQEKEIA
jgi:hypothetical protein|tara:strand:+ start:66 stop:257 length:192 start_codon:yes stop_codon:yes gene_type:complete